MAKYTRTMKSNRCRITYQRETLVLEELGKDYDVVKEIPFEDFVRNFIDLDGISISIGYDEEV